MHRKNLFGLRRGVRLPSAVSYIRPALGRELGSNGAHVEGGPNGGSLEALSRVAEALRTKAEGA